VLVFQNGWLLEPVLGFEATGIIESWLPLFLFAILFGLSMDYQVFLLSRIKERYDQTGNTREAVGHGLGRTGSIITGAAAIMAAVFFGFATARSVIIQAVGIGIGLAVVIDATIVRALLVPATMRLMGRWNWWAPAPLASLHRRLGLAERSSNAEIIPR